MTTKLGYLGPEGTYTEQAAQQIIMELNLTSNPIPLLPIETVFSELEARHIDMAVVPRRNSIVGDYIETVQCLQRYDVRQIHMIRMRIILAIGALPESREQGITEVWSKDTALGECNLYLDRHFPGARRLDVQSTAYAMQQIAERSLQQAAAIGSELGLKKYGLRIIDSDIGNDRENYTTFIALERGGSR